MMSSPSTGAPFPAARTTLDRLADHQRAQVVALVDPQEAQGLERTRHLADIGFIPGEEVAIVARSWPAGDPLVVCVGSARFALRGVEAACIQVQPHA
ncbi:MAG: ferrous iron transport protein A [Betaproteobacteria bacterium]|nr:ferrous iron transport protein A [Betaproteobacteria bacterium]